MERPVAEHTRTRHKNERRPRGATGSTARALPEEAFDVSELLERAAHDDHALAGWVGVPGREPAVRQHAGGTVAAP
jgi:hypothetical protein